MRHISQMDRKGRGISAGGLLAGFIVVAAAGQAAAQLEHPTPPRFVAEVPDLPPVPKGFDVGSWTPWAYAADGTIYGYADANLDGRQMFKARRRRRTARRRSSRLAARVPEPIGVERPHGRGDCGSAPHSGDAPRTRRRRFRSPSETKLPGGARLYGRGPCSLCRLLVARARRLNRRGLVSAGPGSAGSRVVKPIQSRMSRPVWYSEELEEEVSP